MIDKKRREILQRLEEIYELSDDVRFGQLLDFLGFLAKDAGQKSLAEIEDEALLEVIERHRQDLLGRCSTATQRS